MRRELRFKTFEDALAELDRLEKGPVETLGRWSHYQILTHCAGAVEKSMDRFSNRAPWLVRQTLGRWTKWRILRQGFFNPGMGKQKPDRVEGDAKAAAVKLRESIAKFRAHQGPLDEHPFCGPLTREEWEKFHLYHLADHLGYLRLI